MKTITLRSLIGAAALVAVVTIGASVTPAMAATPAARPHTSPFNRFTGMPM